ncbi:MAG TPA: MarR family transcriptional regulator [Mobilitalea sp.]|nr:MarR family transcriptional regulator [Mobilitalea sp.]
MRAEVKELVETLSEVFKAIHQRSYHKMENKNLYPGQPKLLTLIRVKEGITQKDLAKLTFVTPATITGMLNKLEANKYVYRVPDEIDKRIMHVYLTPEGRQFSEAGELYIVSMMEQIFDCFDDEELLTFLTLSKKLKSNLRNIDKQ